MFSVFWDQIVNFKVKFELKLKRNFIGQSKMDNPDENNTNDGLECFNFKLFLDDINSSSHKKRSMFMSPKQETFRRNSLSYSHKFGSKDQFIQRNLGGDFKSTLKSIEKIEEFSLEHSGSRAGQK